MDFSASSLSSYNHLIFISSAIVFSIWIVSRKSKGKAIKLPPGPPGWPIVGNLFQFSNSGKQFFEFVRDLLPVYGHIFTLQMGSRTKVIISSADIAHEALIQKGMVFASRPSETPTLTIFSCDNFMVTSSVYGPVWRTLRRNMVQNILSPSRIEEFRVVRAMAMDKLIERIRTEAESNDGVVWVLKNARFAALSILLAISFGVEMTDDTVEKIDKLMKIVLITLESRIDDYLPLLRPFFPNHRKHASQVRREQIETLAPFIEKRREILRNPGSDGSAASFSYLDTIFNVTIEGRKSSPKDPEIVTLCSEFLIGGTDTTGTAIEWGIARLIENPAIQSKLYEEITATVGSRKVKEGDLDKMVYLQAFCKELLRKHPPSYFSLTHAVTEPATLSGYDIPTGTDVEFFFPAISEDPKLWSSPERFDPDRFLSGGEDADLTGVMGVKMIPFGAGRRICPGLAMATMHLHLMIARMVQEFEWSAYPEGSNVNFSETLQFTVVMKNPLRAKIKSRV